MVLAIIAASLALVMFILSVIGANVGVPRYMHHRPDQVSYELTELLAFIAE